MGKVVMYASVSVDGFVADENDQAGPLFDWLTSGDVPLDESGVLRVSQTSYDYIRPYWDQIGVTLCGRHVFDITDGWDGEPPIDGASVIDRAHRRLCVSSHRPKPDGSLRKLQLLVVLVAFVNLRSFAVRYETQPFGQCAHATLRATALGDAIGVAASGDARVACRAWPRSACAEARLVALRTVPLSSCAVRRVPGERVTAKRSGPRVRSTRDPGQS